MKRAVDVLRLSPEEFEAWHQAQMERLARQHEEHMEEWKKFQTPEFKEGLLQEVLNRTHSNIPPPWED